MRRIAFIFPGQGSQYVGMGREFYEEYETARKIFLQADDTLRRNISDLCFNGPKEELMSTDNNQAAIVTMCIAIFKVLEEQGISCKAVAGLSLGEYTALIAGGAISFEEGLKVVEARGKYMKEASESLKGSMAAVIGGKIEDIEEMCEQLSLKGTIAIANYNSPSQVVISGEEELIDEALEELKKKGIRRAIKLAVSGGFHTKLMEKASVNLENKLKDVAFKKMGVEFIPNRTGEKLSDKQDLKKLLKEQVVSSVLWQRSVENMISMGINTFIEIGPGKSLSGFVKNINKVVEVFNVENKDTLIEVIDKLSV